jgi:hypothetical protein
MLQDRFAGGVARVVEQLPTLQMRDLEFKPQFPLPYPQKIHE